MKIRIAVEDDLSETTLRRLLRESGHRYEIEFCYPQRNSGKPIIEKSGWGYLYANRKVFEQVSAFVPHILLVDLDNRPCAPGMITKWFGHDLSSGNLLFRVAEKEVEAWLLADFDNLMEFLQVPNARRPKQVSSIRHAKEAIVCYAAKSENLDIRKAMLPLKRRFGAVGPGFNVHLKQFVQNTWDWHQAAKHSDSLMRAVHSIQTFPSRIKKLLPVKTARSRKGAKKR